MRLSAFLANVRASASRPTLLPEWASLRAPGALLRTLEGHSDWVDSVAITPDGLRIVSGANDNTVRVWALDTGELQESTRILGACPMKRRVRWASSPSDAGKFAELTAVGYEFPARLDLADGSNIAQPLETSIDSCGAVVIVTRPQDLGALAGVGCVRQGGLYALLEQERR